MTDQNVIKQEVGNAYKFLKLLKLEAEVHIPENLNLPVLTVDYYQLYIVQDPNSSDWSWKIVDNDWPKPPPEDDKLFASHQMIDAMLYIADSIHQDVKELAVFRWTYEKDLK